ncbi:MAG: hypothetical protein ABIM44_02470 [candidate division WOR-3 bacterium]
MKKSVGLLFVLISCAPQNSYLDEFFMDYFPLKTGMSWVFLSSDGREVRMEVVSDTIVNPQTNRYVVELMGDLNYFLKSKDGVFLEYGFSEIVNNQSIVFDEDVLPLFYQPVFKGQFFADTVSRVITIGGDRVYYRRLFFSEVSKGAFGRVHLRYRVQNSVAIGEVEKYTDQCFFYVLAPDTGPVFIQRVTDCDTINFNLIEFKAK